MSNNEMKCRSFLMSAGALAATPLLGGIGCARTSAQQPEAASSRPTAPTAPASLGRRRLGSLEVSRVGLGVQNMTRTYQTTVPSRPQMIEIIRTAFDRGVTFFDAAEAYGPHEVERLFGEAVQPFRDKVVIASKFGWNIDLETRRAPARSRQPPGPHQASRRRHAEAARDRPHRSALPASRRSGGPDRGRRRLGEGPDEPRQGATLGPVRDGLQTLRRAHAALPVTAVQNEYSMLWRGPEAEVIPTCQELGIGFVPWSPLGVGFLTGAIDERTRFAEGDIRGAETRFSAENLAHNRALVTLLKTWAERKRAAPAQLALAWVMAQQPWIVPIPGTTQLAHMLENIGAANVRFTSAELAELNVSVRAVEVRGARLPDAVQVFSGVETAPKR